MVNDTRENYTASGMACLNSKYMYTLYALAPVFPNGKDRNSTNLDETPQKCGVSSKYVLFDTINTFLEKNAHEETWTKQIHVHVNTVSRRKSPQKPC